MAPLPTNLTITYFFDYITGVSSLSREHTFQVRVNTGSPPTDTVVQGNVQSFLSGIGAANLITGWRILRARKRLANAVFSFPITLDGTLASFAGTNETATTLVQQAREYSWQGRSTATGRRCDVSLYGLNVGEGTNLRIGLGEGMDSLVANSVGLLNSLSNVFCALDGSEVLWYSYINVNYNSYWERRIRG